MKIIDQYRCLVSGYFGIRELDEYQLKEYLLQIIEEYIKSFVETNEISNINYLEEAAVINNTTPIKRKLQDSLLVLNRIDASIEVILLVKKKIKELDEMDIY